MHCPHTLSSALLSINLYDIKIYIQISPKKSWEHRELNPGPLGAKRERYPLCYAAPPQGLDFKTSKLSSVFQHLRQLFRGRELPAEAQEVRHLDGQHRQEQQRIAVLHHDGQNSLVTKHLAKQWNEPEIVA